MSPCHVSFEELHRNFLRIIYSGFVSVTGHRRPFKMQRISALPSEMSSQDTQTLAASIQWAPSQLGKVHYTAEGVSMITSDLSGLIVSARVVCHQTHPQCVWPQVDVWRWGLAERVPPCMCPIASSEVKMKSMHAQERLQSGQSLEEKKFVFCCFECSYKMIALMVIWQQFWSAVHRQWVICLGYYFCMYRVSIYMMFCMWQKWKVTSYS